MQFPKPLRTLAIAAVVLSIASSGARGGVVHDESSDGDLSNSPNAPTPLTFAVGANTVIGSVVGAADTRDYITFTIPAGRELSALTLVQYIHLTTGTAGNTGYHFLDAGSTSVFPSMSTAGNLLGGAHVAGFQAGNDLLPLLGSAPQGGSGFTVPLGPGTYTYEIQQTGGNDPTGYTLEFEVSCAGSAQAIPYGAGKAGTNGVPTLGSSQPPVLGGIADLTIGNGLAAASPVLLFLGIAPAALPFDGGALLTTPIATLILPPLDGAGALSLPFPVPADASLCGASGYFQVVFVDPGAGGFYQTAQTNGLQWVFGS